MMFRTKAESAVSLVNLLFASPLCWIGCHQLWPSCIQFPSVSKGHPPSATMDCRRGEATVTGTEPSLLSWELQGQRTSSSDCIFLSRVCIKTRSQVNRMYEIFFWVLGVDKTPVLMSKRETAGWVHKMRYWFFFYWIWLTGEEWWHLGIKWNR